MAGGYVLTMFLLGLAGFRYDSGAYPIQGHPGRLFVYGGLLFLIPFFTGALRLSRGFPNQPAPGKAGDSRGAGRLAGREGGL